MKHGIRTLTRLRTFWVMVAIGGCGARTSLNGPSGDDSSSGSGGQTGGATSGGGRSGVGGQTGGVPSSGGRSGSSGAGENAGEPSTGGVPETGGADVGAGGDLFLWRESSEPLCLEGQRTSQAAESQIWADERGVFVASADQGTQLHLNDGKGWKEFWSDPGGSFYLALSGVEQGSLFLAAPVQCSILEISRSGASTCSGVPTAPRPLFLVGESDGFAGNQDRIIFYDGVEWRQWGDRLPATGATVSSLWADDEVLHVATNVGLYTYVRPSSVPTLDSQLGERNLKAVWAASQNEAWVATADGELLRNDGQGWETLARVPGDCPAIEQIWSDGSDLFVRSEYGLYSVSRRGAIKTLFDTGCFATEHLTSMWGLSATEVFFAVELPSVMSEGLCRGVTLYWTNGEKVTRF